MQVKACLLIGLLGRKCPWIVFLTISIFLVCGIGLAGSCKTTRHDYEMEAMIRLAEACRSYMTEFDSMAKMSPQEMMTNLSGGNIRGITFYSFEKRVNKIAFENGSFVLNDGRRVGVFFSADKILVAVLDYEPRVEQSQKLNLKCIVQGL